LNELRNGGSPRTGLYKDIYDVVRRVPRGKVATYGQIACIVGQPNKARHVGWALAALRNTIPDEPVPWQRVVSTCGEARVGHQQVVMLQEEGVKFDLKGRVDLQRYGWDGL
jgi:methylated-DNA-protein-cysteine methyltransferase-like protein